VKIFAAAGPRNGGHDCDSVSSLAPAKIVHLREIMVSIFDQENKLIIFMTSI